ncbi:MAG: LamG domain-containing protein [Candidatus Marinimicrobia bacterium]|nr:LamG domain-containing protein [Candidatus Neomarinimicrobiota bacterium]
MKRIAVTMGLMLLFGAGAARADLVMYFSFDQATMIDDDGAQKTITADIGSDGTIEANAGDLANKSVSGKFGNAVTLDGNDYVNLSANVATIGSLTTGSIAFWFKTTGGFGTFLSGSDASDASSEIRVFPWDTSGRLAYESRNDATTLFRQITPAVPPGVKYNDGEWHHITAISKASGNELYVNGTLTGVTSVAGNSFLSAVEGLDTLLVGAARGTGEKWFYTGAIDELGIWDHALSQSEIDALQTGAIPEPTTGVFLFLGALLLRFVRWRR